MARKQPKTTIAVIEDDPELLYGLREVLGAQGYEVITIADGQQALERLGEVVPDLVVLDLMLPAIDGMEVCRHLRRLYPALPILILSARGREADKVEALRLGADDYVTKPFGLSELLARIEALLRRIQREDRLRLGDLEIDLAGRQVRRRGRDVPLTATEFGILRLLIRARGQVVSREDMLTGVWGYDAGPDLRVVDYHIRSLRKKLEKRPGEPTVIVTVYGEGYRLGG